MLIYLAAAEQLEHSAALVLAKAPHILLSYFKMFASRTTTMSAALMAACMSAKKRFVDSGAHTVRTSVSTVTGHRENDYGPVDLDLYLDAYIKWLRRVVKLRLVDWWVELDIGEMTGADWVNRARTKFLGNGLGQGLIQVWHSNHDWDYWLYLLREASRPGRSRYVAIEGHQPTRPVLEYNRFLREAYARGVRVHGFKMTKAEDCRAYPFYSVDSTSWLTPVYAAAPVLLRAGGASQQRGIKGMGMGRRRKWMGEIPRKQTRTWRKDMLQTSIKTWLLAERHLDDLWKLKGIDWEVALKNPEIKDEPAVAVG